MQFNTLHATIVSQTTAMTVTMMSWEMVVWAIVQGVQKIIASHVTPPQWTVAGNAMNTLFVWIVQRKGSAKNAHGLFADLEAVMVFWEHAGSVTKVDATTASLPITAEDARRSPCVVRIVLEAAIGRIVKSAALKIALTADFRRVV